MEELRKRIGTSQSSVRTTPEVLVGRKQTLKEPASKNGISKNQKIVGDDGLVSDDAVNDAKICWACCKSGHIAGTTDLNVCTAAKGSGNGYVAIPKWVSSTKRKQIAVWRSLHPTVPKKG